MQIRGSLYSGGHIRPKPRPSHHSCTSSCWRGPAITFLLKNSLGLNELLVSSLRIYLLSSTAGKSLWKSSHQPFQRPSRRMAFRVPGRQVQPSEVSRPCSRAGRTSCALLVDGGSLTSSPLHPEASPDSIPLGPSRWAPRLQPQVGCEIPPPRVGSPGPAPPQQCEEGLSRPLPCFIQTEAPCP